MLETLSERIGENIGCWKDEDCVIDVVAGVEFGARRNHFELGISSEQL